MSEDTDEFDWIDRLRPLTRGNLAALELTDDVAVLRTRPGHDLVVSKDAMVEGVHFLAGEDADVVARRLLRTNLSDLAAKGAEPFGYLLMTAWPAARGREDRDAFIRGLAMDGERFDISLLGGDTVMTPGPLTVSATVMGWAPSGRAVLRSGAQGGDILVVVGTIGDGGLGLKAALGQIEDPGGFLASRFRLPEPMLGLHDALREDAMACADVSDGLLADLAHVADASNCGAIIDLGLMPISRHAQLWLDVQPDRTAALLELASSGDDYALVCAAQEAEPLLQAATRLGIPSAVVGSFRAEPGLAVSVDGVAVEPGVMGWRHT